MPARIALVSAREVVDGDLDEDVSVLLPALAARGLAGEPTVWDDPGVDWASYDVAVVRSTWDYAARRTEFLQWAAATAAVTRLVNRPEILRWNTDKRYLRDLADAGVAVVPTTWIEPGDPVALPQRGEYVVKPAVSAGSRDTARYRAGHSDAVARAHVEMLQAASRTVMVQPYVTDIDVAGETALCYVAGDYSHSVRKGPLLRLDQAPVPGLFAEEDIAFREASPAELAVGEAVLDAIPSDRTDLLYARVDVVSCEDGNPCVLEVELTEPSLFLAAADGTADRLATAIARLI